jgi:hypothetical protein
VYGQRRIEDIGGDVMECPNCGGVGSIRPFITANPELTEIACDICKGKKVLPKGMTYDPIWGADLKKARMEQGLTLRQYCLKNGIDAAERSRWERGFFKVNL